LMIEVPPWEAEVKAKLAAQWQWMPRLPMALGLKLRSFHCSCRWAVFR
jgi:hypothetical protein